MTSAEKNMLPVIKEYCKALEAARWDEAAANAKLDAYHAELDGLVAELRAKHGYDGIVADLGRAKADIETLESNILRDRAFLVMKCMGTLFRADETAVASTRKWLETEWLIEVRHNDEVNDGNFVACFDDYLRQVCVPSWWAAHGREVQPNKMLWTESLKEYRWSPCISVGINVDLFEDVDGFLMSVNRKLDELTRDWADKWSVANVHDEDKRRALWRKLKAEFGG